MAIKNKSALPRPYWVQSPVMMGWAVEAAIRGNVRHVRSVRSHYDPHAGRVFILVRMRWYAYLCVGVLHVQVWIKAKEISDFVSHNWLQSRVVVL
jgi:hypothetical protein